MGQRLRFDERVVIVTGAAGGLGRSMASELAARGARLVVNDLGGSPLGGGADPSLAEGAAADIAASGGEAIASTDSVATPEGAQSIVDAAMDTWGRVDALVANAAINKARHFEDYTIDEWDQVISVNLRGVFCTVQAAYKVMKDRGYGRIVTVTSQAGMCGAYGMAAYATAKAGVVGLTRSVAWEGGRFGVKANALAPAAFDTRMGAEMAAESDACFAGRPPELEYDSDFAYVPMVTASRVAPAVVALAHESCPMSGEILGAFGGHFSRFVLSETTGWLSGVEPTAEDVDEHWSTIRSSAVGLDELDTEVLGWMARAGASVRGLVDQLGQG